MRQIALFMMLCLISSHVGASDEMPLYARVAGWDIRIDDSIGSGCFAIMAYEGDSVLRLGVHRINDTVYLLVGDPSWKSIEYQKEYKLELYFGDETPWTAAATGFSMNPPENEPLLWIEIDATSDSVVPFVLEFMQESSLNIFYMQKSILHLSLKGSYRAGEKLLECEEFVDSMDDDPFSTPATSNDPFSAEHTSVAETPTAEDESPATGTPISGGTCFFVDGFGTAVTSHHLVEGSRRIEVESKDGVRTTAKVTKSSRAVDAAILTTGQISPNFISLAEDNSAFLGQEVFTVGFPATNVLGGSPKYTEGTISALSGLNDDDSWIQMSTPIQPGNSGGPLVSDDGKLVGLVAATAAVENFFSATGALPQNVNWAIKAEYLRPLIPLAINPKKIDSKRDAISHTERSVCKVITY